MMAMIMMNIMRPSTYPSLLTVYGSDRIPAPITVFIIVVTVSRKSV